VWRLRTLASNILLGVLGILFATVVIGGVLEVQGTHQTLNHQYQERARTAANVVAEIPEVRAAVAAGDPSKVIQPLADRIRHSAGASYVVVTDRTGLRFSHPNTSLIGKRLEEPLAVLDGHDHVGIDHGSLGLSANGKAPIFNASGGVIGQVSVGIPVGEVASQLRHEIVSIALYSAIALAVGTAVALLLTRALKRVTFGLELAEIAGLLQEREAMLHGIREGVLGFDVKGKVSLINNEARRLLGISGNVGDMRVDQLVPPGRLRDVLSGEADGTDQVVLTDEALLVVNRTPVVLGGRGIGHVVTLRDRTELEALVRRMNAVTGLANALRAQEHEFTNRLHVIVGLLDLGDAEGARQYLTDITRDQLVSAEDLRSRISPPVVAALLLAKLAVGAERDIEVSITDDSHLDAPASSAQSLMTIIGNLVDNAMDAVASEPGHRKVSVRLRDEDEVLIVVSDNGPGVPTEAIEEIFTDGYSTKTPRGDLRRGIGLALVRRLVHRAGGTITVTPGPGARFEVRLPIREVPLQGVSAAQGAAGTDGST
jgi:two-component system CitB family sensor kinase